MRKTKLWTVMVLAAACPSTLLADAVVESSDLCKLGRSQSPIAIDTRQALPSELHTPSPEYHPAAVVLWNQEGKTVQAQFASSDLLPGPGDNRLWIDGVSFRLLEFHFHRPGEHPKDGSVPALELHLVHGDATGKLAVLAVLIKVEAGAPDHPAIEQLWQWLPAGKDERRLLPQLFDPSSLLPQSRLSYRYPGSLTTGTCAETVRWTVFDQGIAISQEQFEKYAKTFPENHARPVQPANGRVPLLSLP